MNLSDLIKANEGRQITGWASFEGKFDVELAYVDKEDLQKKLDRCKKTVYVKHQPKEELDTDKMHIELARNIISWRGLTLGVVSTMLAIDVPPGQEQEAVVCDDANKLVLLKKAYGFDFFIQQASTDLAVLRREAEEKN